MSEKAILKKLGARLDEMVKQGLTETDEYETISDEYQSLAQSLVLGNLYNGDDDE